jgi:hypothetical protein
MVVQEWPCLIRQKRQAINPNPACFSESFVERTQKFTRLLADFDIILQELSAPQILSSNSHLNNIGMTTQRLGSSSLPLLAAAILKYIEQISGNPQPTRKFGPHGPSIAQGFLWPGGTHPRQQWILRPGHPTPTVALLQLPNLLCVGMGRGNSGGKSRYTRSGVRLYSCIGDRRLRSQIFDSATGRPRRAAILAGSTKLSA